MSVWNKFNRLTKLDFDYEGVLPGTIPKIYANSRNQVDIIISIQVDGVNGPLNLNESDFNGLIYFCDYTSGERIDSHWGTSSFENDYTKPVSQPSIARRRRDVGNPGIIYLHRYLSCSESNVDKIFSIGINIPGIGNFNTSKNGTSTPNGPKGGSGSPFKSPKFLTIATLHPINYSDLKNIVIPEPKKFVDMKKIADDMLITCGDLFMFDKYIGKSFYSSIQIKSRKGYLFRNKIIRRNGIKIPGVNICGVNDSADIVCGVGRRHGYSMRWDCNNFDMTFVFIDAPRCGLSAGSKFHFVQEQWIKNYHIYYTVGPNDHRHCLSPYNSTIPEIDSEYISVVICNHTIPDGAFGEWVLGNEGDYDKGWGNTPSDGVTHIEVLDEYGNSGEIKIKLDYQNRHYPKVTINDQLEFFN